MAQTEFVNLSVEDGVGILQLNHPEKRNALGWELHHQIMAALAAWAWERPWRFTAGAASRTTRSPVS